MKAVYHIIKARNSCAVDTGFKRFHKMQRPTVKFVSTARRPLRVNPSHVPGPARCCSPRHELLGHRCSVDIPRHEPLAMPY
jgi:hypothetical protein